ncbi:hypothetical protein MNBD_DELTA02-340 [hydrothermal vent metagenome]|uniref:Cell division protein FtsL n=1 Tax=hydrothermal vent metagenome TaxID=652676 RepID=A0A3B0VB24_9ZZZZ
MARAVAKDNKRFVFGGQDVRIKRDLKDASFMYTALLVAALVVFVVLLYLWCRLTYVNLGYEMSSFSETRMVELEQNKRLRLELSKLKSPERIEKIAIEQGLIYPGGDRIVYIK